MHSWGLLFLWGPSDHLWDISITDAYWKCGQNDHKQGVVVLNLNSNLVKTIALNFPGWCGPISTVWWNGAPVELSTHSVKVRLAMDGEQPLFVLA